MDDELVAEAKADPTKMRELLEHKRGLVLAVVNRYTGLPLPTTDEDDLIQLGLLGLLDAVRTYDPQKHPSFSTHATLLIRREVSNKAVRPAAQRAHAGVHTVSFQSARPTLDGDDVSLDACPWLAGPHPEDPHEEPDEDYERDVLVRLRLGPLRRRPTKDDARRRIVSSTLTTRQREVLLARLDGKLQRDLGPQQTISDIERRALAKLSHDPLTP